ncbi:MAG: hypothetical protein GWN32_15880, partial [Gemmatimonadetes bacterium]|nr:hypothetical protein [Gemmatimonadota bacterium]
RKLAVVAGLVLLMRWFDLYWHAAPAFGAEGHGAAMSLHWLDLATMIGVGGVWLALYIRELKSRPLLPRFEPFLKEALEDE